MVSPEKHRLSLNLVRNVILTTTGIFVFGQIFVDQSAENILSTLLCIVPILLGCFLIIHPRSARGGTAFTGAAVLLSIFSNSLIPMVGTLIEGNSLVYTLETPVECFGHRLIFALVLIAAHFIADSSIGRSGKTIAGVCADFGGLRSVLTAKQVWIVGGGGLFLQIILKTNILGDGPISKVLHGMTFLAGIPFILVIHPYSKLLKKRPLWIIGIISLYLLGVVSGITSRMSLVGPLALIVTAYLIATLSGQIQLPTIKPAKVMGIILSGIFLLGQLADLSDAIISVRNLRSERSALENFQATIISFLDKEQLREYKKQRAQELVKLEANHGEFWKEDYIANPFLSRFTGIKFDDNLFTTAKHYSNIDILTIKAITLQKIYVMMPQPMIDALDVKVDKAFITTFSMGDLMDVLANKNGFLGGFRVGSITVHSYVVFGWWYPVWLTAFFTLFFFIFQTMGIPAGKAGRATGLSTFALVYGFTLYVGFGMDGYYLLIGMFVRGVWQVFLLYGVAIWVAKIIAPFNPQDTGKRGRKRLSSRSDNNSRRKSYLDSEAVLPPPMRTPPEVSSAP